MSTSRSRSSSRALLGAVALGLCGVLAGAPLASAAAKKPAKGVAKKKPPKTLYQPNGRPPKPAAPFLWDALSNDQSLPSVGSFEAATTAIVPNNKLFTLLIIGSDARPGEDPTKSRSDSVHLIIWNPAWNQGTVIGFPRDLYVTVPGTKNQKKLAEVMPSGGPLAVVSVIQSITKIEITNSRYILTGFQGFVQMMDDLGGVNVLVDPEMRDPASAATFAKGWFAMNGRAALAFNRNRKTVVGGDFTRSANQGKFMLYGLAKMREEISDTPGLVRWVNIFRKSGQTNINIKDMLVIAQIARQVDPNNMGNRVVKAKNAKIKGQDVALLDVADSAGLFDDIRRDAVANGR